MIYRLHIVDGRHRKETTSTPTNHNERKYYTLIAGETELMLDNTRNVPKCQLQNGDTKIQQVRKFK